MPLVYIGLGSNLGDGRENLQTAIRLLAEQVGEVVAVSSLIESEPWGFESEHRFTNGVVALRTTLTPHALLDATQDIERQMGRTHKHLPGEAYMDRIIDLDLLEYEDLVLADSRLSLPHPLIQERSFVRIPLEECKQITKQITS